MFRAFPLPIFMNFLLYIRHWYISCRFDDSFQAGSGWPCLEADDGQWKCPKHVEFFDKIKYGKFVRLFGFIRKKNCDFIYLRFYEMFR